MDITVVKWEDSYGASAGWQSIEDYKPNVLVISSVGYKVFEDDRIIALAPNYAPKTEQTFEQANGLMVIPKSCILDITTIPKPHAPAVVTPTFITKYWNKEVKK